ncbi:hypothetical protein QYF36_001814 [Acer negundo]|nr:hypothetical protein QYF36_001814 [Acer negundo]
MIQIVNVERLEEQIVGSRGDAAVRVDQEDQQGFKSPFFPIDLLEKSGFQVVIGAFQFFFADFLYSFRWPYYVCPLQSRPDSRDTYAQRLSGSEGGIHEHFNMLACLPETIHQVIPRLQQGSPD